MAKKVDTRTAEEKRSYTMSRVRGKGTSIEVLLQKALWHRGIRYRKNYRKAPGSPDIAIVKHKIAIFCDGEFWHGRDWGQKKDKFKSNREYWVAKIERNIERDKRSTRELFEQGWKVLRFWETDIMSNVDACVGQVEMLIRAVEGGSLYSDFVKFERPLMVAEDPGGGYSVKQIDEQKTMLGADGE